MNNLLKILLLQLTTFLIYNSTASCMEKRHNCNDSASMNDLSNTNLDISSPLEVSEANKEILLKDACNKDTRFKRDYNRLVKHIMDKMKAIQAVIDNYNKLSEDLKQIFEKNNMKFALPEEKINKEMSKLLGIKENTRMNGEELVRMTYDKLIEFDQEIDTLRWSSNGNIYPISQAILSEIKANEKTTVSDKLLSRIKEKLINLHDELNKSNNLIIDQNTIYNDILSEIKDKKEITGNELVSITKAKINKSNIAAIFQKILIISKNLIDYLTNIKHIHRYLDTHLDNIKESYRNLVSCGYSSVNSHDLIRKVKHLYKNLIYLKNVPNHDFINTATPYFVEQNKFSIIAALNFWYNQFCNLQMELQNKTTIDDYNSIENTLALWTKIRYIGTRHQSKECLINNMYILNNDFKDNKEIMDKINAFVHDMQTKLYGKEKK